MFEVSHVKCSRDSDDCFLHLCGVLCRSLSRDRFHMKETVNYLHAPQWPHVSGLRHQRNHCSLKGQSCVVRKARGSPNRALAKVFERATLMQRPFCSPYDCV